MRFRLRFAIPLALLLIGGCVGSSNFKPAVGSSIKPAAAVVVEPPDDPLPIPLVELRGDAAALGEQHGRMLGERIRFLEANYLDVRLARGGPMRKAMALGATAMFEKTVLPAHCAEIAAMGQAAGLDPGTAMLAQCF